MRRKSRFGRLFPQITDHHRIKIVDSIEKPGNPGQFWRLAGVRGAPPPAKRRWHSGMILVCDARETFIPQQPVSLPDRSEGLVIVEPNDPAAAAEFDAALRAYYDNKPDADDDAWGDAAARRQNAPDPHFLL
jgi:hypothetical protein